MSWKKTPQEQLNIIRQSCLNRAIDLYIVNCIEAGKLEVTAEYFVTTIYAKLGLVVGTAFTEVQTQGAIVLQSSLARAVELAVGDKINTHEIVDNMYLFADYVYFGVPDAKS